MADDLSLKSVYQLFKQHDPKLLEMVDVVLGPTIILLGLAGAATGIPEAIMLAGGLLGPKNALAGTGSTFLKHIANKKYGGPLDRFQRMQAAYCLLSFTAFFDAIEEIFPEICKAFHLSPSEKLALVRSTREQGAIEPGTRAGKPNLPEEDARRSKTLQQALESFTGLLDQEISLPHPAENSETWEALLKRVYQELARGYKQFVQCLAAWEEADEKTRKRIDEQVANLPSLALTNHRAQYIELARKFPEFFVWATLQKHEEHQQHLARISEYWRRHVELVRTAQNRIDIGFNDLGQAIEALPAAAARFKPAKIIEELLLGYSEYIQQPVVEEDFPAPPGTEPLRFPRRSEAFVPQAFRVLRATGHERLEDEGAWQKVELRPDLGAFILSYLSSPYSLRYPLLILGDPGSGKSLLTHMLAARLICPQFTPIRVELRAVVSEEITQQIEEQVSKDTNGQRVSWPELNDQLREAPALVLLDGYDELLQASGRVYAGYLQSVRQFQHMERTFKRPPVRTIVTSRITLIDKTRVPPGTTVIRLEPFDKPRREKWIEVWNRTNAVYFNQSIPAVFPFELPEGDNQITELAQQPLLLLMLAIYDSYANELRQKKGLDRTRLYENLLWRFVERELSKAPSFRSLEGKQQKQEIHKELDRLGVVAISMFNRRSLLIHSDELEKDLSFLNRVQQRDVPEGRALRQSEMLLGSFFFVHESRSASKGTTATEADVEAAFQFLHNTFGEFLAARFLVERVVEQVNQVHHLKQLQVLSTTLHRGLMDPNGLDQGWVAGLIYTPLFSRPVVLEMVREWLPHRIKDMINVDDFRLSLDIIIDAELRRILERAQFPSLMSSPAQASFRALPLLGHLAIYSNNLIVLRATIPDGQFVFEEKKYGTYEDGTRPWDRLAHLWRSWFALDSLHGLTAILVTERLDDTVHLRVRERFTTPSPRARLEAVRDVGRALGDGVLAGLAALESWDARRSDPGELERIREDLERERIGLQIEVMTRRLRSWPRVTRTDNLERIIEECIELVVSIGSEQPAKTAEMVRALWEITRQIEWYPAGERILHVVTSWAMEGPEEVSIVALELLTDLGLPIDPRLIEKVTERLLSLAQRSKDPRHHVVLLRAAMTIGHWSLARHLGKDLVSRGKRRQPRKGKGGRPYVEREPFIGTMDKLGVDVTLSLLQIAAVAREEHWTRALVEGLWMGSLHPRKMSMLPEHAAIEAFRLLPQFADLLMARKWLEHFFEIANERRPMHSYSREPWSPLGITPAVMLAAASAAAHMELPIAARLADALVHSHPRHLFAFWYAPDRWRSTAPVESVALGVLPQAEQIVRVVRLATDKEQAGRWLSDFVRELLLPASGGVEKFPVGLLVELAQAVVELRLDPKVIHIDPELLRHNLRETAKLAETVATLVEGIERPREPSKK